MLEKYQKKLINFMIFMDLPKMKKSLPQDYGKYQTFAAQRTSQSCLC